MRRSLSELGPQDILIAPDLNGVSFMDFRANERAMAQGARAARAVASTLQALAVSAADYAAHESLRLAGPAVADPAAAITSPVRRTTSSSALDLLI